eukprot:1192148-Prorocentrum_minimum.AAC.2
MTASTNRLAAGVLRGRLHLRHLRVRVGGCRERRVLRRVHRYLRGCYGRRHWCRPIPRGGGQRGRVPCRKTAAEGPPAGRARHGH